MARRVRGFVGVDFGEDSGLESMESTRLPSPSSSIVLVRLLKVERGRGTSLTQQIMQSDLLKVVVKSY